MDSIERLKYQITFGFLAPSIEGQKKMTPTYQAHIETAKGLFGEIVGGLESIAYSLKGLHTTWNPAEVEIAGRILTLYGYELSNLPKEQVRVLAEYFRDRIKIFEKLKDNSEEVYEKFFDKVRLFDVCEKFKKFYAENHQVLGEETQENVEDEYFIDRSQDEQPIKL